MSGPGPRDESPQRAEAGADLEYQRGQPKPGLHDQPAESGLPFSKARCIALVATVTGASFMNVCLRSEPYRLKATY
jgi:hypothetical protein